MGIISHTDIDGSPVLAISTGLSEYAAAKSRLQRGNMSPGYHISPEGSVTLWITGGTFTRDASTDARVEHSGIVSVYGPEFDGNPLLDTIRETDAATAWNFLHTVLSAIYRASREAEEWGQDLIEEAGRSGPGGILCAKDGSILIPGEVYRRCLSAHGDIAEREARFEWVHPDHEHQTGDVNLAFIGAALGYRIATGISPYMTGSLWELQPKSGETERAFISHLIRAQYLLPPDIVQPAIDPRFSNMVNRILTGTTKTGLQELLAFGESFSAISGSKDATANRAAETQQESNIQRMKRRLARSIFIRKNSTKMTIAGIVLTFFVIFGSMYIADMKAKPTTAGMEADEVVTGFYEAVAALDATIITAYATNQAAREYINLVSGIYMTNRLIGRHETDLAFADPDRLFRDSLNASHTVFGITRLKIEELDTNSEEKKFLVSFYMFLPEETRELDADTMLARTEQPLTVYRYRDRCTLTRSNDRWRITGLDSLERAIVEQSSRTIFSAIAAGTGNSLPYAPEEY